MRMEAKRRALDEIAARQDAVSAGLKQRWFSDRSGWETWAVHRLPVNLPLFPSRAIRPRTRLPVLSDNALLADDASCPQSIYSHGSLELTGSLPDRVGYSAGT